MSTAVPADRSSAQTWLREKQRTCYGDLDAVADEPVVPIIRAWSRRYMIRSSTLLTPRSRATQFPPGSNLRTWWAARTPGSQRGGHRGIKGLPSAAKEGAPHGTHVPSLALIKLSGVGGPVVAAFVHFRRASLIIAPLYLHMQPMTDAVLHNRGHPDSSALAQNFA